MSLQWFHSCMNHMTAQFETVFIIFIYMQKKLPESLVKSGLNVVTSMKTVQEVCVCVCLLYLSQLKLNHGLCMQIHN